MLFPHTVRFQSLITGTPFKFSRTVSSLKNRRVPSRFVQAMPLPVILCGKTSQIALGVKRGLEPEYEVIHIILTPSAGISDIPLLLQGQTPPPPSSQEENLGTRNYARVPVAVITGGGYDDAAFGTMYEAAKDGRRVKWLRPDLSVETPPLGPEYGVHMVGRVKASLEKLKAEGKLEDKEVGEDVVLF